MVTAPAKLNKDSMVSEDAPDFFKIGGVSVQPRKNHAKNVFLDQITAKSHAQLRHRPNPLPSSDDRDSAVSFDAPAFFKVPGVPVEKRR